jgi:hypothetical protein
LRTKRYLNGDEVNKSINDTKKKNGGKKNKTNNKKIKQDVLLG